MRVVRAARRAVPSCAMRHGQQAARRAGATIQVLTASLETPKYIKSETTSAQHRQSPLLSSPLLYSLLCSTLLYSALLYYAPCPERLQRS
eukprot:10855227-Alexandrium_andersonii.AAC.1